MPLCGSRPVRFWRGLVQLLGRFEPQVDDFRLDFEKVVGALLAQPSLSVIFSLSLSLSLSLFPGIARSGLPGGSSGSPP